MVYYLNKLLYRLWECFDECCVDGIRICWMDGRFRRRLASKLLAEIGDRDIEKHGKRNKLVETARSTVNRKTYDHTVLCIYKRDH